MNPLPPSDVRRQGDRLRRRNNVLAGVGAAVAVAVIVTPLAILGTRGDGDASPDPAPTPQTEWLQSIPADFPLGDGMPDDAVVSDDPPYGEIVMETVHLCDSEVWSADDARDLLGAMWTNGIEGGEQRTLAVYADDAAAEEAVRAFDDAIGGGCSIGNQNMSTDVNPLSSQGTLGWVESYVREGAPSGARVGQLTLVGNALLLDHVFVPEQSGAVTEQAAQTLADGASGVVEAMCVFSPLGCAGESEPPETIDPDPNAVTDIPDGIDITTGMAENESGEPVVATPEGEGVAELVICDTPTLPADGVRDRLAANASGPEYSDARELRTYGSAEEAQAAIDGMIDAVEACPTEDFTTTTWVNTITDGTLGEDSYTVTTTYLENGEPTLGAIWRHVVRIGNAIFVSVGSGEAFPGPSFDRFLVKDANKLAPIINSFACEFSELSCSSEGTGPAPISNGFPLAAGWPEQSEGGDYGLEGPGRDVELFAYSPCGVEVPKPIGSDSLRAQWSNVTDNRSRELVTFADADEAVAYMAESREFFEGCPQDEIDSQGFQSFWRVIGTEVGGGSYAVVQTEEFEGVPNVHRSVLHFIRVGHSVLIDTTSNEGGAGQDPVADLARQIDQQTSDAAEVVAAMCTFTEAGC
jgi:hypothetical protein